MQQAQLPPVGFQTEILYRDNPYTNPLYDSRFLDCSDDEACQMLADIDSISYRTHIAAKSYLCKYPLEPVRRSFVHRIMQGFSEWWPSESERLRMGGYDEYYSLVESNLLTELEYIRCEIKTLVAMRLLYILCLQIIDNPPKNTRNVECCISLLEAVSQYVDTAAQGRAGYYNFINPVLDYIHSQMDGCGNTTLFDEIQRDIQLINRPMILRPFPLADVYLGFISEYEHKYKSYDIVTKPHKTIDATDSASSNGAFAPWWKVECCRESVQLDYRCYCRSLDLPEDLKDTLTQADAVQLAGFLIDNLDLRLNKAVEGTVPVLSARNGLVTWSARKIVQAEYLCLFRDLLQNKQFRICPICKLVFTVQGRGVTRVYCKNHTQNQIEYYKRRISKPHAE